MARKPLGNNEGPVPQTSMDAILAETKILDLDSKTPALKNPEKKTEAIPESNQDCEEILDDIEEDLSRCVSELEAVSSEWDDLQGSSKDDIPAVDPGKLSADLTDIGQDDFVDGDSCRNADRQGSPEPEQEAGDASSEQDESVADDVCAGRSNGRDDSASISALREELTQKGISDVPSDEAMHPRRISRSPSPDIAGMSIGHEEAPPSRASSGAASPPRPLRVNVGEQEAEKGAAADEGEARDERPKAVMPWPRRADKEYECLESCGAGSYGEVYKAVRRGGDEIVAVKVIESDMDALEEAALLRDLDHKCICKLYDCFECPEEGVTCLVMQYASGGDLLSKIIDSGPLTEKVAADLSKQLLLALQHMHSKGVLHRDLKPENVLYLTDSMEQPLLADFGVGKRLAVQNKRESSLGSIEEPPPSISLYRQVSGLRTHSRRIGTVGYSAPEINSEQGHSFAADVWSFGALIYVLLCGYHPFDVGDDADEVIQERVSKGEVLPMEGDGWEYVSPEAKDFVKQCLVVDVKARATIENCLQHPWLKMDFMEVVELVDAFQKLKVYHSTRRESKTVAAKETATRLKRKREASVASDDSSAGSLTPTPSKRFLNVPYHPTTVCQQGILEWAVSESEPSLEPLKVSGERAEGLPKPARKRAISGAVPAGKFFEREAGDTSERQGTAWGKAEAEGGSETSPVGAAAAAAAADGKGRGGEGREGEGADAGGSSSGSKKRSPTGEAADESVSPPLKAKGRDGKSHAGSKEGLRSKGRSLFTLDEGSQSVAVWQVDSGEDSLEKLTLGPEDRQTSSKPAQDAREEASSDAELAADAEADAEDGEREDGEDRLDCSAKRKRGRSADVDSPSETRA